MRLCEADGSPELPVYWGRAHVCIILKKASQYWNILRDCFVTAYL